MWNLCTLLVLPPHHKSSKPNNYMFCLSENWCMSNLYFQLYIVCFLVLQTSKLHFKQAMELTTKMYEHTHLNFSDWGTCKRELWWNDENVLGAETQRCSSDKNYGFVECNCSYRAVKRYWALGQKSDNHKKAVECRMHLWVMKNCRAPRTGMQQEPQDGFVEHSNNGIAVILFVSIWCSYPCFEREKHDLGKRWWCLRSAMLVPSGGL